MRQEREDVRDDPRSGGPPITFVETKILSVLERQSFRCAHSPTDVVRVPFSTLTRHLRDSSAMKNFHLRWVPHELTPDLCRRRLEIYGRFPGILDAWEFDSFQMFITGDDSSIVSEYHHSTT
jgi:hypothetical protein